MIYAHTLNIAKNKPYSAAEFAILADSRETHIIPLLGDINVRQIECGDFQIWRRLNDSERPVIIIERKTWSDLASSIVDGRADSQHERMLKFGQDTGALIYYIIEGVLFQQPGRVFSRNNLTFASLVKRLDHLADSRQIIVKHSRDHEDTARRINELVRNYSDNPHPPHPVENIGTFVPPDCRQSSAKSLKYWCAMSGVSVKLAAILSKHYCIADILKMPTTPDNITAITNCIKTGGGRCGVKIATRILSANAVRFLSSIRGVSKVRATAIANEYPTCLADLAANCNDMVAKINSIGGVRKNTTISAKIQAAIFSA
jgi:ERCC4-type nuclease